MFHKSDDGVPGEDELGSLEVLIAETLLARGNFAGDTSDYESDHDLGEGEPEKASPRRRASRDGDEHVIDVSPEKGPEGGGEAQNAEGAGSNPASPAPRRNSARRTSTREKQARKKPRAQLDISRSFMEHPPVRETTRSWQSVDDFIRAFLVRHELGKSLDAFQLEWFTKGVSDTEQVPLTFECYIKK